MMESVEPSEHDDQDFGGQNYPGDAVGDPQMDKDDRIKQSSEPQPILEPHLELPHGQSLPADVIDQVKGLNLPEPVTSDINVSKDSKDPYSQVDSSDQIQQSNKSKPVIEPSLESTQSQCIPTDVINQVEVLGVTEPIANDIKDTNNPNDQSSICEAKKEEIDMISMELKRKCVTSDEIPCKNLSSFLEDRNGAKSPSGSEELQNDRGVASSSMPSTIAQTQDPSYMSIDAQNPAQCVQTTGSQGKYNNEITMLQEENKKLVEVIRFYENIHEDIAAKIDQIVKDYQQKLEALELDNKRYQEEVGNLDRAYHYTYNRYKDLKSSSVAQKEKEIQMFKVNEELRNALNLTSQRISELMNEIQEVSAKGSSEIAKMDAALRLDSIKISGLEKTISELDRQNKELTEICEEFVRRSSS
ncbi:hypothetical protein RF11_01232 [Thelohanellus kitauei]|uniref:Uncharacterized protein n=1 Tax=Thelohanellus kitauei TaxID=669202 RepID=A0A0C2IXA0_THEKT|nr:hypothetical protein RF11_01232 [Thelohanellus kitauei]